MEKYCTTYDPFPVLEHYTTMIEKQIITDKYKSMNQRSPHLMLIHEFFRTNSSKESVQLSNVLSEKIKWHILAIYR